MYALTIKGLWAHKLRYALTGVAVVLGVAFMVGTLVLTDTMGKTFDDVVASANDGTDVIVRRDDAIEGELATVRDRVDAGLVERVGAVDGVAVARGQVQGATQLVDADGTASATDGPTDGQGATVGANWIDDPRLNPFTLASGRAPEADDEAVIDQHTAADQGWALGDRVEVLGKAGPTDLIIVGTARYGDLGGVPGSSLVATTDATAQRLFGEPGRYDRVAATAAEGISPADLQMRVVASVAPPGSGLEALTGRQDTAEKQADLHHDLAFFDQFLMAFAYVSLFVGMFIIYNTFSIVVAQRSADLAMLRALGARCGQVLRAVVLEAIMVGVVAAGVGLAAGIGLSFGLRALLVAGGLDVPSGRLVVAGSTVVTALVVGVGVSVIAAVVPALRAGRVRPVAALRDVAVERTRPSLRRVAAGMVLAGAGAAAFVAGLSASGRSGLPLVGVGALAVVLGTFTLGPVLVGPAVRILGIPSRLFGVTGRYARENARRNPKRTAASASALMIGVALVGFITIFASSTKASISGIVDRSFRADYVVESGSRTQGFSPTIEDQLRAVPGVGTLSPLRSTPAVAGGATTSVMGLETGVIDELYDLDVTSGSMASVRGDGVAVTADKARDQHLSIGDPVPFRFGDGQDQILTVQAVFDGNAIGGEATWIVGLDTFERHVADQFDRRVFLSVDGGSTPQTRAALDAVLGAWPNAELQDQGQFRATITGQIDRMLNLVYGLLALAVVIALIGIANTLALSVHERTRELGLLRAVGMQRRQLRRAVRWESLLIAALGAGLGLVLAIGGAWGVVTALGDQGITKLILPVGQLAVIAGAAGVAGVLAAMGPARRAARLDVLAALSTS